MKSKIIKIMAWGLILAFVAQDAVWANPEFFENRPGVSTLQAPSFFRPLDAKIDKQVLEVTLKSILEYAHELLVDGEFRYHLTPTVGNVLLDLEFDKARKEGGAIIVPCRAFSGRTARSYQALISHDRSVELIPGAAKLPIATSNETVSKIQPSSPDMAKGKEDPVKKEDGSISGQGGGKVNGRIMHHPENSFSVTDDPVFGFMGNLGARAPGITGRHFGRFFFADSSMPGDRTLQNPLPGLAGSRSPGLEEKKSGLGSVISDFIGGNTGIPEDTMRRLAQITKDLEALKGKGNEVFAASGFKIEVRSQNEQILNQLTSGDRDIFWKIIKGGMVDVNDISAYNGKVYICKDEIPLQDKEGRTVYLDLDQPIKSDGVIINVIRFKGVRTRLDGNGIPVIYNGRGALTSKDVTVDAVGKITTVDYIPSVFGGITAGNAEREYSAMLSGINISGVKVDHPLIWGVYPDMYFASHQDNCAFVAAGMTQPDRRLDVVEKNGQIKIAVYSCKSGGREWFSDGGIKAMTDLGATLRMFHRSGNFHDCPHLGNVGVNKEGNKQDLILRDLDHSSSCMNLEQHPAYRLIDFYSVLSRFLKDKNKKRRDLSEAYYLIEPFFSGYFGDDVDILGEEKGLPLFIRRVSAMPYNRNELFRGLKTPGHFMNMLYLLSERDISKNRGGSGGTGAQLNAKEAAPVRFLRDIVDTEKLTQNMIEGILSALFSNKKLTLALNKKLKGLKSTQLSTLVKQLEKWKEDTGRKNPRMKALLNNFTVFEYDDLETALEDHGVDINDKDALILDYTPKPEEGPKNLKAVKSVYIIEEGEFPESFYYPLLEMVTISLAKELLDWDERALNEALTKSSIDKEFFGIEPTIDENTGILIFKILPKMVRYNTNERVDRYTKLLRFLHSA